MIELAYNKPENIHETETETGIVRSVVVQRTSKDGEIINKEIFTPSVVEAYENIDYLRSLKDVSEKGTAIEISLLDDETLKKEGFKGGVMDFITQVFGKSLAINTAQKYRKIGLVFGNKTVDENGKIKYSWLAPIPDDVSVTNLTQIIALLNLPRDYMNLSKSEIEKIRDTFVKTYIITGKLHLDATNEILRKDLKNLKKDENVIETTAEEITGDENGNTAETEPENATTEELDERTEDERKRDVAIEYIDYLKIYFKGDKNALKAIATLVKILG